MSEQTDFLEEAIEAMDNSKQVESIADYDLIGGAYYQMRQAHVLALLSLAQDIRRIADALERQAAGDDLAASVRIFGS